MEDPKSILHELYVYSEWKPEPEYIQKPDGLLPENISALWRWMNFLGPKKSLIDSVTAHKEKQQKWHIALGDEGKVIAVLTDNILEIRTKRSDYATIAARTTVSRDAYAQWRKLAWSPDCAFVVLAYGNGVVSFFDLTASNLFNIPIDCSRPGGLECTDNTHAVADIIFMPLRVKDTKWSWEVLIVNYDGKVRGYLVSQMDGFTLHHTNTFSGGIGCVAYCDLHSTLYVAGVPRASSKDPNSAHSAGITAWRILNDEPYYKLSVVSDQLEGQANDKFQIYIPFVSAKNLAFIVQMVLSPDGGKLVCLHCNGEVSVWRLPLLKLLHRFPLASQPGHDLRNPLIPEERASKDLANFYAADVNWWSNEEVIISRFSGAVSVSNVKDLVNILGQRPEFFQGTPRVTRAFDGAFVALECEASVLPARTAADDNMEVVEAREDKAESAWEVCRELVKSVLYSITDMEAFQPRPRRVTCVSRVYRLLAVKSTTPTELFSRKIESGNYSEALKLAETFNLDSDLVYQQQWRKNPVSTEAIDKYLSKVSKKIWAVHQCVDRLPETLPAAKELLQFGLELTNEKILEEINKDRPEDDKIESGEDILPEHLNAYTSELLRCRHVMLFYKERLSLYESILKYEKSTYIKDEYDRLRSNSIMRSSMEIAKEGRIEALTCLWPHIKTTAMKLAVLEKLPETINPLDYQHLLPTKTPMQWFETKSPIKIPKTQYEPDWCRKQIFRSIWSSNWSEETTPDSDATYEISESAEDITKWYDKRAREIEERSGLVSHSLTLTTLATVGGGVEGLDNIMFHLLTLDTLVYDINAEGMTLKELENLTTLETCAHLMQNSNEETFVSDLKTYVVPFLKRYEKLARIPDACLSTLMDFLESISVDDLAPILLLLQSSREYKLDVRTHLELAERCLLAHDSTDQLDLACDLLATILTDTDGTISPTELVRRVGELERLVFGSNKLAWRGVSVTPLVLRDTRSSPAQAAALLTRLARSLHHSETKPTQADWEKLLKDILELQSTLFNCVTREQCYEIYASSLLTSGDMTSIKLASNVLTCSAAGHGGQVQYPRSVQLVNNAASEYVNSASHLTDPALELAKCCLTLINDGHPAIQQELDLIASFQILHCFNLNILPIQVRLCEDKMTLIEDCLKSDPNAFLASHKLLKLATLLRIAPGDDIARESGVLQLVGSYAMAAGDGGCGAAVSAARRLAALRARAAPLLARVARTAHAHADRNTRRQLLAAALATCQPADIDALLRDRLSLELEGLQQMGVTLKETNPQLSERCPSTDDEFADAITTPVIEKKDLIAPAHTEKKVPLINYLLDTFQNKLSLSDASDSQTDKESHPRTVHVPQFYRSIYPTHLSTDAYYGYGQFSAPSPPIAHHLLHCYYVQNCLCEPANRMDTEVVQKCAEELLYKDTPLSVSCMLHSSKNRTESCRRFVDTHHTDTAISCALYATLIQCNGQQLKDNVYLTKPKLMAEETMKQQNATKEQVELIKQCIARLSGMAEVDCLKELGFSVNPLLFNADEDYRNEIIYRVAGSPRQEHLSAALRLARKYGADVTSVWLRHAAAAPAAPHLTLASLPDVTSHRDTHDRILEGLYPQIEGSNHAALLQLFTLLKGLDEKPPIFGLTAAEHIKLLKKAKSACSELDYKLLIEQPTADQLTQHLLTILKPENIGAVGKFLRTLPPALKLPVPVNVIYTKWLTKYFFSVPVNQSSSKKWMQQYRQCASYFNKLPHEEILRFMRDTCFSHAAVKRVPHGTRILMIMQAVDYCQQEQENDYKFNKNEQSWAAVGEQLSRWGQYLELFHSPAVQHVIENSNIPADDQLWLELECSAGSVEALTAALARTLARRAAEAALVRRLAQLLPAPPLPALMLHAARHCLLHATQTDVETLISRLTDYHKDGVDIPAEVLERVLEKAESLSLPPQQQIMLLSLGGEHKGDMKQCAQYSLDLFRNEWPDDPYVKSLTEEFLQSDTGRREVFRTLLEKADSIQKRKALVDVLACWPPVRDDDWKSMQCEFLHTLLHRAQQREALVYIRLLLRQPLLTEQEVKWLAETVTPESTINAVWIILLNKSPTAREDIVKLLQLHKETVQLQEIEDTLIKELLDYKMLIPLIPTVLYASVVHYIVGQTNMDENTDDIVYDVRWAASELVQANHLAEAGHIYLMASGVPAPLRGFSETVKFCKNMLLFEQ